MTGFYRFVCSVTAVLARILFRFRVTGEENIPTDQNFIVCCNHISLIDPIFLMLAFPKRCICFMAKESLFRKPVLGWALRKLRAIPIYRGGKGNLSAVKTGNEVLQNNDVLGIFPEGTRSKTGQLLQGKSGAVMIANRVGCPIVPCAVLTAKGKVRPFRKVLLRIGSPISLECIAVENNSSSQLRNGTKYLMGEIASLMEDA